MNSSEWKPKIELMMDACMQFKTSKSAAARHTGGLTTRRNTHTKKNTRLKQTGKYQSATSCQPMVLKNSLQQAQITKDTN